MKLDFICHLITFVLIFFTFLSGVVVLDITDAFNLNLDIFKQVSYLESKTSNCELLENLDDLKINQFGKGDALNVGENKNQSSMRYVGCFVFISALALVKLAFFM